MFFVPNPRSTLQMQTQLCIKASPPPPRRHRGALFSYTEAQGGSSPALTGLAGAWSLLTNRPQSCVRCVTVTRLRNTWVGKAIRVD